MATKIPMVFSLKTIPRTEPAPAPAPAPEPVPEPVPEPEEEESLKDILIKVQNLLKNVLQLLRMRYNNRVLLNGIDVIINELYMIDDDEFQQKFHMINKLYYVKYLVYIRKPRYYVYSAVVRILHQVETLISQM